MNSDERSLRLDNRNLSNLETRVTELQKVLDEQLDPLSDTVLCHSAEIDRLIGRMPESDVHYRGANVPLTPFYGNRDEDFTQYLKQFEIICDANNYKADKKAQILASQLRDKAFFVYDSLTDDQKANYAILKEELCGKFQTTDHQRYAHQKFQARKQGTAESMADYGCNVHKLGMAALTAVEADQRDALIREKFISGLLPHLQELIVYSNPKNFHEAMTFAERLEGVQANKPDRSARHVMLLESIHDRLSKLEVHGPVYASTNLRPDEALAIERAKPQPNASNYAPAMNFGDNRQATRQGGIVCYKCNRTGHLARNCFRNQNMNNVICRNCNAMGHFARNCQRRRVLMRGRGTVSRTGNWTRGRSSNMIGYNQAPARSMGISRPTDDARTSGDEPQRWQPLIGALRIETGKPKVWKVLPTRELSEPPRKQLEHQVRRAVKYNAFLSIAMCLVIIATITGKSTGHEQKFKTSGPMLCQASVAKSLWKLRRSFNCPEGNHSANEDVQEQNFQLYKQNYIQYKSDAWKCVKITEVVETFTYFFGDENLKRQRKQNEPVSSEECIAMKRFKQCGNQEMIFQGVPRVQAPWKYQDGISCGGSFEVLIRTRTCVLKDFSFLIWDTNNNSFCNVLPWKVVPGKLYGTSWLSDDSNLALTFTRKKQIKDCQERPLLLSDQGIAVKPIPNSEEYRQKRQLSMKDIKAMRQFVTKGGIVSCAQLAASMQALEMKWRQNTNFAFSHALNSVCNFMRSVIELLRTQVLADPTNAVRSLTNQSNVFARSGGNVIEIYPCEELERNNYQFMPMNNSCTAQLPIKFQTNNNTHLGYLDPITNIVHRYASPIDCNLVKEVPIQIKDKTFLYQSVSGDVVPATKIPTLKIMQWNIEPVVDMKATIFHEIVIYSWSELQTHISLNDIIGGLLKQQVILKRLGVLNDEEGSNKAADNAVSTIMNRGYFGFLRGLSLNFFQVWTFCVCLYVSVCVLLIHCCPLNGIPTALNLPKAVWTLKEKLTQAQIKSAADTEPAEPSAPQLLRNLSRTSHEIRPLNLYNVGPPFQLSSPPQLKALPPPQLNSFSVSEDYLTFAPRPLHKAYPSLPVSGTTLETEPQPFRINCLSGLSQTIVNVWLDQLYLKALLDTGSDFSIINEVTYNRLKKPLEGPIRQAQTATDQIICTSGEVKATLRTATTETLGSFAVVVGSRYELMIGTDLLKEIGPIMFNFAERIVKIRTDILFMAASQSEKQAAEEARKSRTTRKPNAELESQSTFSIAAQHQAEILTANGNDAPVNVLSVTRLSMPNSRNSMIFKDEPRMINQSQAENSVSGSSEITIFTEIEGMKVRTLIDTGSSLTIVPVGIAQMLQNPTKPASIKAISMTGHSLNVVGEVATVIRAGAADLMGTVVVKRHLPYELVIGTDLLKQFDTVMLDFKRRQIRLGQSLLPMNQLEQPAGVFLCQQVSIPPMTKVPVMGLCYGLKPSEIRDAQTCCFTPSKKLLTKYEVMTPEALVNPCEKLVPILLTNADKAPKYLPQKVTLGSVKVLNPESIEITEPYGKINEILQPVSPRNPTEMIEFRKNIHVDEDLSEINKSRIICLIEQYETLFAKHEYDLGETPLVEHSINTGDAKPIRQAPYRPLMPCDHT